MLNSRAIDRLGLDQGADAAGVERDAAGCATGRLFRLDRWLREQLRSDAAPDLAPVGKLLARAGITGVTTRRPTPTQAPWRSWRRPWLRAHSPSDSQ